MGSNDVELQTLWSRLDWSADRTSLSWKHVGASSTPCCAAGRSCSDLGARAHFRFGIDKTIRL